MTGWDWERRQTVRLDAAAGRFTYRSSAFRTEPGRWAILAVTGDERVDLAQGLPVEAAPALTAQIPDTEQLTGWGFLKDLAARTGVSPVIARWDTGAVLAVVTRLAGPALLARTLHQLPDGYALLFGHTELRRPQPTTA
ncbi:DUF2267 domain-containing protein [Streptomyces erythrochromogenes]|uniref:DUF2267 domain-containing protein n=1 Tax=Streptomyces erythrochromogenes TaxID=285574 RepID=UPI0022526252|nr:DUF2267 domain-containing protein [Streptomyces erythrochromogenes]MCX5583167.1 DUF2267 domain-containing protein [Streptomyces erythrochromogenes]